MDHQTLLSRVLKQPDYVQKLNTSNWQALISQAYSTDTICKLAQLIYTDSLKKYIPDSIHWHFKSALILTESHQIDVNICMDKIIKSLSGVGIKPILLKGAAYQASSLKAGKGRIFNDVDFYIPKDKLNTIEQILLWSGWSYGEISNYDMAYYKEWAHELPPLSHSSPCLTIDVHHNLIPVTSRITIPIEKLEQEANISADPRFKILSTRDMILHSAVHLFLGEEFENSFRDLNDIYFLLEEALDTQPKFIESLKSRAKELNIEFILEYCLSQINYFYGSLPGINQPEIKVKNKITDKLFNIVLDPEYKLSQKSALLYKVANFMLFVRAHYLKMPLNILLKHTLHKWRAGEKSPQTHG